MDLVTCSAPAGRVEPAPLTSLVPQDPSGTWGGFWGEDDAYYVRRALPGGEERWFRVAEDAGARRTGALVAGAKAMTEVAGTPGGGAGAGRRVVFLFRAGARGGRVTSLAIRVGPSRRRR